MTCQQLTWCSVDRLRLPLCVPELFDHGVVRRRERLGALVLVLQVLALNERRNDAPDGIGAFAEMPPDRLGHFV